ncbi:MAG: LLM class flavin-dependent oxidoreductase [Myxococcales bacterium]|nr:LLM class flavin-dependent oxidoreductase [Myxococcales bacterium]
MFTMRFDMRAPSTGASTRELYTAAVDMAEWGDQHGCASLLVSEHHASPDGYLPAPFLLASAMAARTRDVPIQIAATLAPLHDPVSLAEQMVVLDILSGGRASFVCAVGYRPEEYAMFGHSYKGRGRRMEECLRVIQQAFAGEPFEYEGRQVHVTPPPLTPGGPPLLMGGASPVVVKRAARFGMGVLLQADDPALEPIYLAACQEAGTTPGIFIGPAEDPVASGFVSEDPDRTWAEIGPHLLHDAHMYAAWMGDAGALSKSSALDVESLRAENGAYRVFTPDEAVAHIRKSGALMTQPLSGGLPPKYGWETLELLASKVLPALKES